MARNEHISQQFMVVDKECFGVNSLDAVNNAELTPLKIAVRDRKMISAFGLLVAGANPNDALRLSIMDKSIELHNRLNLMKMAVVTGAYVGYEDSGENAILQLAKDNLPDKETRKEVCELILRSQRSTPEDEVDHKNDYLKRPLPGIKQELADKPKTDSAAKADLHGCRVLCLDGGGIRGLITIQILQAIERESGRKIKDCFDCISGTSTGGILALAITRGFDLRYCFGSYLQFKDQVFSRWRGVWIAGLYDSKPMETFLKELFGEKTTMDSAKPPFDPRVIVTSVLVDRQPPALHLFRNYKGPQCLRAQSKHLDPIRYPYFVDDELAAGKRPPTIKVNKGPEDVSVMRGDPVIIEAELDTVSEATLIYELYRIGGNGVVHNNRRNAIDNIRIVVTYRKPCITITFNSAEYIDSGLYLLYVKDDYGQAFDYFTIDVQETLVWQVARATSAAPLYFSKFQKYVDGGLLANNPTLDTMTEIQLLNDEGLKFPIKLLVSLGTGRETTHSFDGFGYKFWKKPSDIVRYIKGAIDAFSLIEDVSTNSDGDVVKRAEAWCEGIGAHYYRLSPQLEELVKLSCTDDMKLVDMMFETHCYINRHIESIKELVKFCMPASVR